MNKQILCLAPLVLALIPLPALAVCATLEDFAWLEGEWQSPAPSTVFKERWGRQADGSYRGEAAAHAKGEDAATGHETLRLFSRDGGLVYEAHPKQNPAPVAFPLVSCDPNQGFVFENPDHDFPQRIVYEPLGPDRFDAHVTDLEGRGFDLHFVRAGHEPDE